MYKRKGLHQLAHNSADWVLLSLAFVFMAYLAKNYAKSNQNPFWLIRKGDPQAD
jgi:hypothetical protein